MTSRLDVYTAFKHYKRDKDIRTMDEICDPSGDWQLQVQQKFLRDYVEKHPDWRALLHYGELGSGKSCTSIVVAHKYLELNPTHKVTVILPARLRTNMVDELISPCGMEHYISRADFIRYHDPQTSSHAKSKIRKAFTEAINARFDIMSFEKFKATAYKAPNLQEWCHDFTKNRLIVIDEVHNLINDTYKPDQLTQMMTSHQIKKGSKGINTLLFRYMTKHAHASTKFLFMTATPIFDNIGQLRELVMGVSPETKLSSRPTLPEAIDALQGKISYFPGTSPTAYPSVSYQDHEIPFSLLQDEQTYAIQAASEDEENPDKEAFLMKQRQVSIIAKVRQNIRAKLHLHLDDVAPKIKDLLHTITAHQGKHVVFSNFIKNGLHILRDVMLANGWVEYTASLDLSTAPKGKVFALWDGSLKDIEKQTIKSVVNSKQNMSGDLIRVILGSPSIKEGVSFKHVQHIHLLDPVWNQSAKSQVEGRAIRFCSHVDIPKDHPILKRHVVIHLYKSVPRPKGLVLQSCDQLIYDEIIPKKYTSVKIAEDALKKVAIDYYLFRRMYRSSPLPSPQSSESPMNIEDIPLKKKTKKNKKVNTCPKPRRPDSLTGKCPRPDQYVAKNLQGDDCCYKARVKKMSTDPKQPKPPSCPKGRTPPCAEGFKVKTNKKGIECCFKQRVSKKTLSN